MTNISTSSLSGTPWTPKGDELGLTSLDYLLIGRLLVHGGLNHSEVAKVIGIPWPEGEALDLPSPHDVYGRTPRAAFAKHIGTQLDKGYLAMDEHPRRPGEFRFYLRPEFFERCAQKAQTTQAEYQHTETESTIALSVADFVLCAKSDGRADLKDVEECDLALLLRVAGELTPAKLTPQIVLEVAQQMAKPAPAKRASAKRIRLPDQRPCRLLALREFIRWCIRQYAWNAAEWREAVLTIQGLERSISGNGL